MSKVPFETMREIINDRAVDVDTIEFYGAEIAVKRMIPYEDYCSAVNYIVECCYSEDDGEYMPEIREFATRVVIARYYTDLELPADAEELYAMMFKTDLMDLVYSRINESQLAELHRAVAKRCDVRNNANRAAFEKELRDALNEMEALAQGVAAVFDGLNESEMHGIVKALSSGKLDEEKLAAAVVNARNMVHEDEGVIPFPAGGEQDGE